MRRVWLGLIGACAIVAAVRPAQAEVTAEQVRQSIERGVDFLKSRQTPEGKWTPDHPTQQGGVTALCTLALLNSGVPVDDPVIQRALRYLRTLEPKQTYAAALQTMVFAVAEPERDRLLIRRNVEWLEATQIKNGDGQGSWGYGNSSRADNSNAQFALLALHEAERVGVSAREQTWRLALNHWLKSQREDGSWGYTTGPEHPSTGSMTCAGISSLVIASGRLSSGQAQVNDGKVNCCGQGERDDPVARALLWLGERFSVDRNPAPPGPLGEMHSEAYLLYYLYGVERVGRLTGHRFFGRHDWYRRGAEMLVGQQDPLTGHWKGVGFAESNELIASSFALLFLSKGRRPTLISRAQYGADDQWNTHRGALQNLTRYVELNWKRDLTWQTIDLRAATLEDMLETPVLFLSGRGSLDLSREQKENLRQYVLQGGFIFAEACHGYGCDATQFDREFRELIAELFPESPLRFLPPDHPIWYAEEKVNPKYMKPLYGIDACCRTSIVYSSQTLSCFWELGRDHRRDYPEEVQAEIDAALALGRNVVAYATNRQLKEKLDRPRVLERVTSNGPERGVVTIGKLDHAGGSNDAPNALANLASVAAEELDADIRAADHLISPASPELYDYPIVFMHGRRSFRFSDADRQSLRLYLQRGGLLFADAICASPEFAQSFRREIAAMFPDAQLARISPDHPLLTSRLRGFDLARVSLRDPQVRRDADDPLATRIVEGPPTLECLVIEDRLAVVFSPFDLSCALENHPSVECKGYLQQDAARIGINILLYALQE